MSGGLGNPCDLKSSRSYFSCAVKKVYSLQIDSFVVEAVAELKILPQILLTAGRAAVVVPIEAIAAELPPGIFKNKFTGLAH